MLASNRQTETAKLSVAGGSTADVRGSDIRVTAILGSLTAGAGGSSLLPLNLSGNNSASASSTAADSPSILLTPTTYSRLEQTLLELNHQLVPQSDTSSASMAIKREHENNNDSDDDTFTGDDSVSGDDWATSSSGGGKMARIDVAVDYSRSSSSHSGNEMSGSLSSTSKGPRRHTGPRKPRNCEKLSPEEEEKRRLRRERNKHAAAKCRQKRVDLTNQLLAETEKLESEQAKLQNEIKAFQREKDELEFILDAHRLHCGVGKTAVSAESLVKMEAADGNVVVVLASNPVSSTTTSAATVLTEPSSSEDRCVGIRRPTSLTTKLVSGPRQVAGVAITTPSAGLNVFTLGLESMIDGHTGLTPITGPPSCGPSNNLLHSPTTLMHL